MIRLEITTRWNPSTETLKISLKEGSQTKDLVISLANSKDPRHIGLQVTQALLELRNPQGYSRSIPRKRVSVEEIDYLIAHVLAASTGAELEEP